MVEEVTVQNFDAKVLNSDKPVLVDFFATWCGPCKMMSPTIDEIAAENEGTYDVYKVDIDENPDLVEKYGVMGVPTFVTFVDGKVKNKAVGAQPKQQILNLF